MEGSPICIFMDNMFNHYDKLLGDDTRLVLGEAWLRVINTNKPHKIT